MFLVQELYWFFDCFGFINVFPSSSVDYQSKFIALNCCVVVGLW